MNNKLKGYSIVFTSTVVFYIMTVVVKVITNMNRLPGTEVTFFRFFIGLVIAIAIIFPHRKEKAYQITNRKALLKRGVCGAIAITLFFLVIQYSTTTKANIYNQSMPIYIAMLGPLLLKDEKYSIKSTIAVIIAIIGIVLISGMGVGKFGWVDLMGIAMGVIASIGIIALREARKTENSNIILLYLMGIGTFVTSILFGSQFKMPTTVEFMLLLLMGVLSYLGQYLLSVGYKYASPLEGSLISSSRIFIAAIFGTILFGEPFTVSIVLGGVLIFLSILMLGVSKKQSEPEEDEDRDEDEEGNAFTSCNPCTSK